MVAHPLWAGAGAGHLQSEDESEAGETVQVLFIQLGEKLLPTATQLITFVTSTAIPAITNFISMITGTSQEAEILRPILITLGIAIAGVLVAAFIAWTVAAGAAAVATIAATWPILAAGAAIALLVAGLIWAYNNWGFFRTAVQGAEKDFENIVPWVKLAGATLVISLASLAISSACSPI